MHFRLQPDKNTSNGKRIHVANGELPEFIQMAMLECKNGFFLWVSRAIGLFECKNNLEN